MKSFLGICNWNRIHIPNYVSLAALHMDSLAGKYKYNPDKRTNKVPAHRQTISWTDLMHEKFEKINTSLCEACSLYGPSDQGEFAIHTDAPDHSINAVLEQNDDQRKGVPVRFSVKNSRAASNTTLTGTSSGIWARENGQ